MNKKLLLVVCLCGLALGLITGCAAKPAGSSSPPVSASVAAPAASAPASLSPDATDLIKQAVAKPPAPFDGLGWEAMFNGKTLAGWRETEFAGRAEAECNSGMILFHMGDPFTGINYTNEIPKMNYEVAFDAMRVNGSDFFCALTFPVGETCCSLIVGGWGGGVVGLSSLDGMDASENETSGYMKFNDGQWYRIRLRVTERKIEAWIDDDKVLNLDTAERRISVRPGDIELSQPFGLAAWQTASGFREIKIRRVYSPDKPAK